MDWFLYDKGLRYERVNRHVTFVTLKRSFSKFVNLHNVKKINMIGQNFH